MCPRTDTNRQTRTGTNRGVIETGKWKRTAGTEPKFCGNRTENHSYIWIWYVKLCENNYLSIHFLNPSFPSFPGLRITSTAKQLWPRNISILMERLSKYCNSQYPCSILNSTIPQPPWRHFWEQTLLSGGCGKWVQLTSLGLEILCCNGKIEQILNSLYLCSILNSTIPQPP